MTFSSEANAKFCLDFFHRLRKDHPEESILFSPLNMSASLHLLHYGSRGDSATEIEKVLHLADEEEPPTPESRENSEETSSCNASEVSPRASFTDDLFDNFSMSTEGPEECITDAEGDQDGTAQDQSKTLAEDCEAKERPSVLELLQSPETDARQMDTSIHTDSQSTSDEGASASFLSWSKNIPSEEGVSILRHEQPSSEGVESLNLVNTSKNQDGLVADISSSAEETKLASDNSDIYSENIHNSSCVDPGDHVNGEDTETKTGTSSLVIHLVSETHNKEPVTKSHSAQRREGIIPQYDMAANIVPGTENKFLSQEQFSQEDHQNQGESAESHRESVTFPDGSSPSFDAHLEAERGRLPGNPFHKYRHNITTRESKNTGTENRLSPQCVLPSCETNEAINDLVQTLGDNSSRFDSDEDASSDFLPWSADYPEKEDEVISQEWLTPDDHVSDNQISSLKNKQISFLNRPEATNPPGSFSGVEGDIRLNNGHIEKENMNNEESEGEEENALPDSKTTHSQQQSTLGHKMENGLFSARLAISSSYYLPWGKYLRGREQREALRQASYQLLENLSEPLESRMYNYIPRTKKCPLASD